MIQSWTPKKDLALWKELDVSHQITDRLASMGLKYFRTNIATITPLKEREIGLPSKLFQFPFQTAFCTDLNSQSFIRVKRSPGSLSSWTYWNFLNLLFTFSLRADFKK